MEAANVGVRTRARAMAMAMVSEEMVDGLGVVVKRRKLSNEKLRSTFVQIKPHDECHEVIGNLGIEGELVDSSHVSPSVRSGGGQVAACCSGTGSTEKPKALDMEVESVKDEFVKLSTPKSDIKEESSEMDRNEVEELPETNKSSPKMPPEAEIEEFFAAAQENVNKRFKHKYNFDIVHDIPLKGRFEWIQLNPDK